MLRLARYARFVVRFVAWRRLFVEVQWVLHSLGKDLGRSNTWISVGQLHLQPSNIEANYNNSTSPSRRTVISTTSLRSGINLSSTTSQVPLRSG